MAFIKSKKVYAILMNSDEGKDIVEKAPQLSDEELQKEIDNFFGSSGQANPEKEGSKKQYTKQELLEKYGTDDLDIINAGNEETIELKEDNTKKQANNREYPYQKQDKKLNALNEQVGNGNFKQSKYDPNVYENEDGEEYLVVDEDTANEMAKDEVKSFIEEQGVGGFTEAFRDEITYQTIQNMGDSLVDEWVDYAEDEKEKQYYERMRGDVNEIIDYIRYNFGEEELNRIVNENLDEDWVAEEAISWDGLGHFLSYYDGMDLYLGDNLYAFRRN